MYRQLSSSVPILADFNEAAAAGAGGGGSGRRGRPRVIPTMGEFDLSLISEFRNRPSFYDRNSSRFKDKIYNAHQWQEISNKLGFDVSIIKDRMLQLRNRYNLEKRRLEQFREENPGKSIESPWPLYDHLHFLSDHIRARRSYKKMMPLTYQQQSSSSLSQQQALSHHQMVDEHGRDEDDNVPYRNSESYMDRKHVIAANQVSFPSSLLRVKMEENDTDDSDEATDCQSNDMEGFIAEPSTSLSMSKKMHASAYIANEQQQQQQQLQLQQQLQQSVNSTEYEVLASTVVRTTPTTNTNDGNNNGMAAAGATGNLPAISIRRLESLRSAASSMNNNKPNKKRAASTSLVYPHDQQELSGNYGEMMRTISNNNHPTAPQALSSHSNNMIISSIKQPCLISQRDQTYIAFSNFVTSSLLDLPQNAALDLINHFTKDIVNALMDKTTRNAAENGDTTMHNLVT